MLHYKVSDIVKRAKDIADTRGSDFVDDEEMTSLLNESWTDIYSKLINLNDKSFLNKVEISGEETTLPEDFYQLGFVVDELNQPVERYTVGALGSWYELVNDTIQLHNVGKAYLYYYSTPVTLTFPKSTISNIPTKSEEDISSPSTPQFYIKEWGQLYCKNGIVLYKDSNFKKYYKHRKNIFSKESAEVDAYGWNVIVDYEGSQYVYKAFKPEAGEGSNYSWKDLYIDGEKIELQTTEYSKLTDSLDSFTSQVFYHVGPHKWIVWQPGWNPAYYSLEYDDGVDLIYLDRQSVKNGTYTGLADDDFTFETVIDGHLYSEDIKACYLDGDLVYKKGIEPDIREGVVFGVNYETGYGAFFNNVYSIYSILPDTELNFPSNIYFNILAYQVAYAIACKQGKDTTFIEKQLASQWDTFYNTLDRDGFGQSKVINTYRGDYV